MHKVFDRASLPTAKAYGVIVPAKTALYMKTNETRHFPADGELGATVYIKVAMQTMQGPMSANAMAGFTLDEGA